MAITATAASALKHYKTWNVVATADGDTSQTIPHGFGAVPEDISLLPLLQAPAGLSLWAVTNVDATNITIAKSTATGSGNAGAQVRVIARMHSLTH